MSVVLQSGGLEAVAVEGAVVFRCWVVLDSDGPSWSCRVLRSSGGAGLRKVSLLTEMKALPLLEGVTLLTCDPVGLKVAWGVEGERQRDGSVPPGPLLTVVGLSRGGAGKAAPLRPSWLSSDPSSVSSSEESTSWMASCFCRDSLRSARS